MKNLIARIEALEQEVFKPMYSSYAGKNYRFQAGKLYVSKQGKWIKINHEKLQNPR